MARVTKVNAIKDCKLDCGHEVKAGAEIVITSFYTTPQVAPLVKAAVMGMLWALNPPAPKGAVPVQKKPHSVTK